LAQVVEGAGDEFFNSAQGDVHALGNLLVGEVFLEAQFQRLAAAVRQFGEHGKSYWQMNTILHILISDLSKCDSTSAGEQDKHSMEIHKKSLTARPLLIGSPVSDFLYT